MHKEVVLKALYKTEKLIPINGSLSKLATKQWLTSELFNSLKKFQRFAEAKMDGDCISLRVSKRRIYSFTCSIEIENTRNTIPSSFALISLLCSGYQFLVASSYQYHPT